MYSDPIEQAAATGGQAAKPQFEAVVMRGCLFLHLRVFPDSRWHAMLNEQVMRAIASNPKTVVTLPVGSPCQPGFDSFAVAVHANGSQIGYVEYDGGDARALEAEREFRYFVRPAFTPPHPLPIIEAKIDPVPAKSDWSRGFDEGFAKARDLYENRAAQAELRWRNAEDEVGALKRKIAEVGP